MNSIVTTSILENFFANPPPTPLAPTNTDELRSSNCTPVDVKENRRVSHQLQISRTAESDSTSRTALFRSFMVTGIDSYTYLRTMILDSESSINMGFSPTKNSQLAPREKLRDTIKGISAIHQTLRDEGSFGPLSDEHR
ncbi:hypothetical protein TNCV_1616781 [Trichonephila clavipes]|nr:hypothetical protein TNCV_1616781 [Trichonephila clavipes]